MAKTKPEGQQEFDFEAGEIVSTVDEEHVDDEFDDDGGDGEDEKKEKFKVWEGITSDEALSLFYKACRIGHARMAIAAYELMSWKFGYNDWWVLDRLEGLVGEDCAPEEFCKLIPMLHALKSKAREKTLWRHHMWHAIFAVAKAKKWYQTEEGVELEKIRHLFKYEKETTEQTLKSIELPSYVLDLHTARGKMLNKEGKADLRLCGLWFNRFPIYERWTALVKQMQEEAKAQGKPEPTYEQIRKRWIAEHLKTPDGKVGGNRPGRPTEPAGRRKTKTESSEEKKETKKSSSRSKATYKGEIKLKEPGVFTVTSESDPSKTYEVNIVEETCTCPSHVHRGGACKHIKAVRAFVREGAKQAKE